MHVREATPSDAEVIRRVHRLSIEELGPDAYDPKQVDAWARGCETARYTDSITADTDYFVVAEVDMTVVGFGTISFVLDETDAYVTAADAEITAVYVDPTAVRDGVGTAILTALERKARNRACHRIVLLSSMNAVPFYTHHDYERVRTTTHEFSSRDERGVEGAVVEMTKALSA